MRYLTKILEFVTNILSIIVVSNKGFFDCSRDIIRPWGHIWHPIDLKFSSDVTEDASMSSFVAITLSTYWWRHKISGKTLQKAKNSKKWRGHGCVCSIICWGYLMEANSWFFCIVPRYDSTVGDNCSIFFSLVLTDKLLIFNFLKIT